MPRPIHVAAPPNSGDRRHTTVAFTSPLTPVRESAASNTFLEKYRRHRHFRDTADAHRSPARSGSRQLTPVACQQVGGGFPAERYSSSRVGSASRWVRPFQHRLTRCAATTSFLGSRASSHHWAVIDTEPTSAWAYSGAVSGSRPRRAKSPARMDDTWLTASLSRVE